jgi:hypothetical protein
MSTTTLDIQLGDCTLEVTVSYSKGSGRAYFGNGDMEDYSTPTEVDIEDLYITEGSHLDWTNYCASHPNVFDEIEELCVNCLDKRLAA